MNQSLIHYLFYSFLLKEDMAKFNQNSA